MNERDFCLWLHGYFELSDAEALTKAQVKMIKEHLDLVFTKVTPELEKSPPLTERQQAMIDAFTKPYDVQICRSEETMPSLTPEQEKYIEEMKKYDPKMKEMEQPAGTTKKENDIKIPDDETFKKLVEEGKECRKAIEKKTKAVSSCNTYCESPRIC